MDPEYDISQCDTCHLYWQLGWMENGTCIECLEIAEHGISMSEEWASDLHYTGAPDECSIHWPTKAINCEECN